MRIFIREKPSCSHLIRAYVEPLIQHSYWTKSLWSDGGGNTIIYDRIDRWGIDLLHQRSFCRWERRCSVPLHLTPALQILALEVVQRMGAGPLLILICLLFLKSIID
jgi:hypothetical protein